MGNPDFKQAHRVGRVDIMILLIKKMNVSNYGAMVRQNFFDARVYGLLRRLMDIKQQPKETLDAYNIRFNETWDGIRMMGGFVMERDEENEVMATFVSNMLGQIYIAGANSRFDKKKGIALENDLLKHPELTIDLARRMVADWEMAMGNKDDLLQQVNGTGGGNKGQSANVKANKASIDKKAKASSEGNKKKTSGKPRNQVDQAIIDAAVNAAFEKRAKDEKKASDAILSKKKFCTFCGPDSDHYTDGCHQLSEDLKDQCKANREARYAKKDQGK
jgi:hypothetical protein